ncbi:MAG: tRNA pseudouridine(38-40) synthase TruA [Phycisphaerae bacterium]|nr:tRNA pseudouridine(38-40) synthase TruA [Phycisphaerae bacterium]
MPRYKLTIAYDGTDFCGWQRQVTGQGPDEPDASEAGPGELRTVQGVLRRVVARVVREPVVVKGASRTDAGVHARGQVAAFTCSGDAAEGTGWPSERGTERLARAINGKLPPDVCVVGVEDVTRPPGVDAFDPVGDCTSKAYSYTIHALETGEGSLGVRPVFDRRSVTLVWERLDVEAMNRAARHLVGEHDFVAFAAAGHGRLTTVRTILSCAVTDLGEREGGRRVRLDVAGTGFLYNMVRIIAGTLVEVGRGRTRAEGVPAIIAGRERAAAGPTLGPEGLCLEWVRY